jgi:hypothetical protein
VPVVVSVAAGRTLAPLPCHSSTLFDTFISRRPGMRDNPAHFLCRTQRGSTTITVFNSLSRCKTQDTRQCDQQCAPFNSCTRSPTLTIRPARSVVHVCTMYVCSTYLRLARGSSRATMIRRDGWMDHSPHPQPGEMKNEICLIREGGAAAKS